MPPSTDGLSVSWPSSCAVGNEIPWHPFDSGMVKVPRVIDDDQSGMVEVPRALSTTIMPSVLTLTAQYKPDLMYWEVRASKGTECTWPYSIPSADP